MPVSQLRNQIVGCLLSTSCRVVVRTINSPLFWEEAGFKALSESRRPVDQNYITSEKVLF
jgi:hypothetical protein